MRDCGRGRRPPCRRRPAPARGAALVRRASLARAPRSGRRRLRRPALAAAVRARRGSGVAADHRGRDAPSRRLQADEPDRHRALRTHHRGPRQRRAEAALPPADARGRGALVPAVQRARRGVGPREPLDARRARRRHLPRQRPEDLDVARRPRQVRHPHRPHPQRRVEAPRASPTSSSRWTSPASRSGRSAT